MRKIICQVCKGSGQVAGTSNFPHTPSVGPCFNCKGLGRHPVDDTTLREMIMPLPDWISTPLTFACSQCIDDDKVLVPVGLTYDVFDLFSGNKCAIHCPRCGFFKPQYAEKWGVAKESIWIGTINMDEDTLMNLQLWREPFETDTDTMVERWP